MMKLSFHYFLIIYFIGIALPMQAQLFDRLKKKTMDKLEKKAEDKLIEELSEEIARRAFQPVDKAMDDLLRSSYEENEGEEVDWDKAGEAYADFLAGLNKAASVPESYTFDLIMDIEVKDGDKDKHEMQYYFSKGHGHFGIKQFENGKEQLIVIDSNNDLIILYTEDNGNKSAQAVPSAMKMAGTYMNTQKEIDIPEYEITRTGKTKKIAGYTCEQVKLESKDERIESYVASDFPVTFEDSFGPAFRNFMPENYTKNLDKVEGMILYSNYKNELNKKYNSTFDTKKVSESIITINNHEFGLTTGG